MLTFEVLKYKIRVVLNPKWYTSIALVKKPPHAIEGTVISITTISRRAMNTFKNHGILELLSGYDVTRDDGSAIVRWDNDVKSIVSFGALLIRSSDINICNNIWKESKTIRFDNRKLSELRPKQQRFPSLSTPKAFKQTIETLNTFKEYDKLDTICQSKINEYHHVFVKNKWPLKKPNPTFLRLETEEMEAKIDRMTTILENFNSHTKNNMPSVESDTLPQPEEPNIWVQSKKD